MVLLHFFHSPAYGETFLLYYEFEPDTDFIRIVYLYNDLSLIHYYCGLFNICLSVCLCAGGHVFSVHAGVGEGGQY